MRRGLKPAVTEFLAQHGDEWELYERFANNHGLTVLKRRPRPEWPGHDDGGYWLPFTPRRVTRCIGATPPHVAAEINAALAALAAPVADGGEADGGEAVVVCDADVHARLASDDALSPLWLSAWAGDTLALRRDGDGVSWRQLPPPHAEPTEQDAAAAPARVIAAPGAVHDGWRGVLNLTRQEPTRVDCAAETPDTNARDGRMRSHLLALRSLRWMPSAAVLVLEAAARPSDATKRDGGAALRDALRTLGVGEAAAAPYLPRWFVANLAPCFLAPDGAPLYSHPPLAEDVVRGTRFAQASCGRGAHMVAYSRRAHMVAYSRRALSVFDDLWRWLHQDQVLSADEWYNPAVFRRLSERVSLPRILVPSAAFAETADAVDDGYLAGIFHKARAASRARTGE